MPNEIIVAVAVTVAHSIVAALSRCYNDDTIYSIGFADTNVSALRLFESFQRRLTPASFRMVLSKDVKQSSDQIYAIANGAIG